MTERSSLIAIALVTALLGILALDRPAPTLPPTATVQPSPQIAPPRPPTVPPRVVQPPVEARCCICAMEANEQRWRDQQAKEPSRKKRARGPLRHSASR